MELSHSNAQHPHDELNRVVETMGDVSLPENFWNEFKSEIGNTSDLYQNHEELEQLT